MSKLLKFIRAIHSREDGQDVLEFVLLLPFVLFLVLAIIDFGIILDRQQVITHAAREGSRYGAVGKSEAEIRQRAIDQGQSILDGALTSCPLDAANDACVEVAWNDGPDSNVTVGEAGDGVAVRVRYRHHFINPFLAWLPAANSIEIGTCSDSRIEARPASPASKGWDCS